MNSSIDVAGGESLGLQGERVTMANGVESRCPYLDHRFVEFAFSLDDSLRYRDGIGKWIVHQVARKILPKESLLFDRPVKHGLATPVNLWTQGRHSFDRTLFASYH